MPHPLPHQPTRDDREDTGSAAFARLLFIAMLVAMFIGLICGLVWTAYHLVWRSFIG